MSRPVSLSLSGLLCVIASATALAQTPPVLVGAFHGHEVCPQAIEFCGGRAWFAGKFVGQLLDQGPSTSPVLVGASHNALNQTDGGVTQITGGEWVIVLKQDRQLISGIVQPGGTLTYRAASNAFDVALMLLITHGDGSGTVINFWGVLDHNPFPPEIIGMMSQ
jgi:hypothetical protein